MPPVDKWDFSDSSGDDAVGGAAALPVVDPLGAAGAKQAEQKKRPGRPAGVLGDEAFRRKRDEMLAARNVAVAQQQPPAETDTSLWKATLGRATPGLPDGLKFLSVGLDPMFDVVVNMLRSAAPVVPVEAEDSADRFVEMVTCPPKGVPAASHLATCAVAGKSHKTFNRKELILAVGTFFG